MMIQWTVAMNSKTEQIFHWPFTWIESFKSYAIHLRMFQSIGNIYQFEYRTVRQYIRFKVIRYRSLLLKSCLLVVQRRKRYKRWKTKTMTKKNRRCKGVQYTYVWSHLCDNVVKTNQVNAICKKYGKLRNITFRMGSKNEENNLQTIWSVRYDDLLFNDRATTLHQFHFSFVIILPSM